MQLIRQFENSLILFFLIFQFSCGTIGKLRNEENIFKVRENITLNKGFYITYSEDNKPFNDILFPFESYKIGNKLEAIKQLLLFQGDRRLNYKGMQPLKENPYSQRIYKRDSSITLEVEALYIINYLVFDNKYSLFPCIIAKGAKDSDCNTDKNVDKAYEAYKIWFMQVRKVGLDSIVRGRVFPLDNTDLEWY